MRVILRIVAPLLALLALVPGVVAAQAAPGCRPGQTPAYQGGFAALYERLGPDFMGFPLSCEVGDSLSLGNTVQITSRGLAYYRAFTNTPAFFNGQTHAALVPPEFWRGTEYAPAGSVLVFWASDDVDPPASARPAQGSSDWCALLPGGC